MKKFTLGMNEKQRSELSSVVGDALTQAVRDTAKKFGLNPALTTVIVGMDIIGNEKTGSEGFTTVVHNKREKPGFPILPHVMNHLQALTETLATMKKNAIKAVLGAVIDENKKDSSKSAISRLLDKLKAK